MPGMQTSDAAVAELGSVPTYPMINLMRNHGREVAVASALATFALTLRGSNHGSRSSQLITSTALSVAVGGTVAYMHELTQVLASTLLPE